MGARISAEVRDWLDKAGPLVVSPVPASAVMKDRAQRIGDDRHQRPRERSEHFTFKTCQQNHHKAYRQDMSDLKAPRPSFYTLSLLRFMLLAMCRIHVSHQIVKNIASIGSTAQAAVRA
ncbi:protein of unknown function [Pararobbsia alpina]